MFFCSGQIRTVVAMATYSSHRLIMGKEEIDIFFLSQWGYLEKKKKTEMFKLLNLTGCRGGKWG